MGAEQEETESFRAGSQQVRLRPSTSGLLTQLHNLGFVYLFTHTANQILFKNGSPLGTKDIKKVLLLKKSSSIR